jgi:hypothetical protein
MEHVFFARFHTPGKAKDILRMLRDRKLDVDVMDSDVRESSHDMPSGASNVPSAILKGLIGGGLGGLVFGILLGVTGIGPAVPISAAFAALFGALAGTLGAVLIGAQDPDKNLQKTAEQMGPREVILSIHVPDLRLEEEILDLVRRGGGEVVPKAGMKPIDDPRR